MELKKYKLSEVAKVEISSVDKKSKENETQVRLCNFTDVYYNWAITRQMEDSLMVATAKVKEIERFILKKGQVALTKDSETKFDIGISTYIADDFEDVILGYHCALITPDESKLNGKYLNAFMHSKYIQKYFENSASGSGQRYTLSLETLESMPLLLPSLEEQKKIGEIFSSLDKKIALNHAINKNLEALAKQLYDYWFVQFDFPNEEGKPYKSSGGEMVWNEKLKRNIPEGWNVCSLNAHLEIKSGFPFKSDSYIQEGLYRVVTIKNVQDGYLDINGCDCLNEVPEKAKDWIRLKVGDRLISLTGNCGRLCVVTAENLLLNQRVGLLSCGDTELEYFYMMMQSNQFQNLCQNLANGAAQANLSPVELCKSKTLIPSEEILVGFNKLIFPIRNSYIQNCQQNAQLTKQRDELLPLLMNGQVTIK